MGDVVYGGDDNDLIYGRLDQALYGGGGDDVGAGDRARQILDRRGAEGAAGEFRGQRLGLVAAAIGQQQARRPGCNQAAQYPGAGASGSEQQQLQACTKRLHLLGCPGLTCSLVSSPLPPSCPRSNVNIPNVADAPRLPRRVTRLGRRHASQAVIRQTSPRGEPIYWIGPAGDAREAGEGTDFFAAAQGEVSITPLQVDLTDHAGLPQWRRWAVA